MDYANRLIAMAVCLCIALGLLAKMIFGRKPGGIVSLLVCVIFVCMSVGLFFSVLAERV